MYLLTSLLRGELIVEADLLQQLRERIHFFLLLLQAALQTRKTKELLDHGTYFGGVALNAIQLRNQRWPRLASCQCKRHVQAAQWGPEFMGDLNEEILLRRQECGDSRRHLPDGPTQISKFVSSVKKRCIRPR